MLVPEKGAFDGRQVGVADVWGAAVPSGERLQQRPVVPEGVSSYRRDRQRGARVENVSPGAPQATGVVQRSTYTPQQLMADTHTSASVPRQCPLLSVNRKAFCAIQTLTRDGWNVTWCFRFDYVWLFPITQ